MLKRPESATGSSLSDGLSHIRFALGRTFPIFSRESFRGTEHLGALARVREQEMPAGRVAQRPSIAPSVEHGGDGGGNA